MNRKRARGSPADVVRLVLGATVIGMSLGLIILATPPTRPASDAEPPVLVAAPPATAPVDPQADSPVIRNPPKVSLPRPPTDVAVSDLRRRDLTVPVKGIKRANLVDSFDDKRDVIREHEAIDILAPRGTPVVAVESGTIEKYFTSIRGGRTIYQFDATRRYAYYYAHLQGYVPELKEHDRVERGQVIGFVGTSGNAPESTPHLHFAIFLLTDEKRWWRGTPINPFDVWSR